MKEFQYRQKKLLEYLIELNDFKPVRYFSEKLSCSDKTAKSHFGLYHLYSSTKKKH